MFVKTHHFHQRNRYHTIGSTAASSSADRSQYHHLNQAASASHLRLHQTSSASRPPTQSAHIRSTNQPQTSARLKSVEPVVVVVKQQRSLPTTSGPKQEVSVEKVARARSSKSDAYLSPSSRLCETRLDRQTPDTARKRSSTATVACAELECSQRSRPKGLVRSLSLGAQRVKPTATATKTTKTQKQTTRNNDSPVCCCARSKRVQAEAKRWFRLCEQCYIKHVEHFVLADDKSQAHRAAKESAKIKRKCRLVRSLSLNFDESPKLIGGGGGGGGCSSYQSAAAVASTNERNKHSNFIRSLSDSSRYSLLSRLPPNSCKLLVELSGKFVRKFWLFELRNIYLLSLFWRNFISYQFGTLRSSIASLRKQINSATRPKQSSVPKLRKHESTQMGDSFSDYYDELDESSPLARGDCCDSPVGASFGRTFNFGPRTCCARAFQAQQQQQQQQQALALRSDGCGRGTHATEHAQAYAYRYAKPNLRVLPARHTLEQVHQSAISVASHFGQCCAECDERLLSQRPPSSDQRYLSARARRSCNSNGSRASPVAPHSDRQRTQNLYSERATGSLISIATRSDTADSSAGAHRRLRPCSSHQAAAAAAAAAAVASAGVARPQVRAAGTGSLEHGPSGLFQAASASAPPSQRMTRANTAHSTSASDIAKGRSMSQSGARRRLGFKQKLSAGSRPLSINRSEEVVPSEEVLRELAIRPLTETDSFTAMSERTGRLSDSMSSSISTSGSQAMYLRLDCSEHRQLDSRSHSHSVSRPQPHLQPQSKSQDSDPCASFVDGLGVGQVASRQALVAPYLGDIELAISDQRGMLEVEVVQVRHLRARTDSGRLPSPYVKVYLMRDKKCIAKFKTAQVRHTLDPVYRQLFIFRDTSYKDCVLQAIVWGDYGKRERKTPMGVVQIHLSELDTQLRAPTVVGWYRLFNAPSMAPTRAHLSQSSRAAHSFEATGEPRLGLDKSRPKLLSGGQQRSTISMMLPASFIGAKSLSSKQLRQTISAGKLCTTSIRAADSSTSGSARDVERG